EPGGSPSERTAGRAGAVPARRVGRPGAGLGLRLRGDQPRPGAAPGRRRLPRHRDGHRRRGPGVGRAHGRAVPGGHGLEGRRLQRAAGGHSAGRGGLRPGAGRRLDVGRLRPVRRRGPRRRRRRPAGHHPVQRQRRLGRRSGRPRPGPDPATGPLRPGGAGRPDRPRAHPLAVRGRGGRRGGARRRGARPRRPLATGPAAAV
ncbi:MAG: hypothetical protein AVDCRST_MAG48-223, partial [uncultured Friedmanniella sp.]